MEKQDTAFAIFVYGGTVWNESCLVIVVLSSGAET
jgi:hypothetical protein